MFQKDTTISNEQAQDLIGHLVAAIASGQAVTLSGSECSQGCHSAILVNGESAASVVNS